MYKVVQSANIMIEEVANVKELSAVEVERYRAECKFLRNLAYFFMVRILVMYPIIRRLMQLLHCHEWIRQQF